MIFSPFFSPLKVTHSPSLSACGGDVRLTFFFIFVALTQAVVYLLSVDRKVKHWNKYPCNLIYFKCNVNEASYTVFYWHKQTGKRMT